MLKQEINADIAIAIVNFITGLKKSKFELNYSPEIILQIIKSNSNEGYLAGDMKVLREEIKVGLNYLNKNIFKDILSYLKLEKFLINILFVNSKSGFSLEVNSKGLTSVVDELIFQNK